mgnify:CR=1 FL=1|jgi:abortive infection bacteriophage resistance protein
MDKETILYTSTEEQIEKLKSQHLIIADEHAAKTSLLLYGYSNLIKSYREPYVFLQNDKKIYKPNVTFEQICSLYLLDKGLRNSVMAAMLDLEEYIKENVADVVAHAFGTDPKDYLNFRNYRDKKRSKYRFSLPGILKTLNDTIQSDKDPIRHYRCKYGIVPPWILFKNVYFTTIINYISLLKPAEQTALAHRIYNYKLLNLADENIKKLMMDTLFICVDYRNKAAHGGRIYNYTSRSRLRFTEIFGNPVTAEENGIGLLLFLLNLLRYHSPFGRLRNSLDRELNRHLKDYPQDVDFIGNTLNLNITLQDTVYICPHKNNKKYHRNRHCSGMINSQILELQEAEEQGYSPCKKCC